jgi:GxxExxY protein
LIQEGKSVTQRRKERRKTQRKDKTQMLFAVPWEGEMTENEISAIAIGSAIEVHKELGGPGLLEHVYEEAFCRELMLNQINVERQKVIPVLYKGVLLKKRLVLDVLIDEKVVVEIKATEKYNPIFEAQLLTYLRVANKRLGLVVNFGERNVASGVRRVVNQLA